MEEGRLWSQSHRAQLFPPVASASLTQSLEEQLVKRLSAQSVEFDVYAVALSSPTAPFNSLPLCENISACLRKHNPVPCAVVAAGCPSRTAGRR